jgi:hypothetical protein
VLRARVHRGRAILNPFNFNWKHWCPGWESNPHEEKFPEDFKCNAYVCKLLLTSVLYSNTVKMCKFMCKF